MKKFINKDLKCPKCKEFLVRGKNRRYETLSEHCCNPNKYYYQKPPLRDAYVCQNHCYGRNVFWDYEGGVFAPDYWWQKILMRWFNYYNFKNKGREAKDAIFVK